MQNNNDQTPQATLMQMLNGKHISRCLSLAAELGISDLLADSTMDVEGLATATQSHTDALNRVLRLLSRLGVYIEVEEGVYANSNLSNLLRSDHQHSVRSYARWMGTDLHWEVLRDLDYSVRTGKPSILKDTDKENAFEVLQEHAEAQGVFQEAMTGMSHAEGYAIVKAYDWSPYQRIVDVGGGYGTLAKIIAEKAPHARVTVFDLPHVVEGGKPLIAESGLANLKAQAGSFLDAVPGPMDLAILKYVIHDWNDDKAVKILRNCKAALSEEGKILLCEMLITDGPESIPAQIFDIEMLMGPGGKERTIEQYEQLFTRAGLRLGEVTETESPLKLIEAVQA